MMPQSISKLRGKFIWIAAASFLVVILFMGITTYFGNAIAMRSQANATIDAIIDAGGKTPTEENYHGGTFHEEASYGLRFFTVSFDREGNVTDVDLSHVNLMQRDEALEVSLVASDPNTLTSLSQYENYLYKEGLTDTGSMVVFLDCSYQLETTGQTMRYTLILVIIAFVITLASIVVFSGRAIRPEIENARRQQQFMTNASHELKTPIAVIRANTEVSEMISGETEWTQSTLGQVERLEGLVNDLMAIVRGAEQDDEGKPVSELDVSAIVKDVADSFKGPAQQHGLTLENNIADGVKLRGREDTVEQLVCLLLDNAMKYCDDDGTVNVHLAPALIGTGCMLTISNDYAEGSDVDYNRFFERFYREDESHKNQQGYGIGLSVAESICQRYHGSIKASWKAGRISFTCVLKGA